MSASTATPTKEWLKGQLVSHSVPLPASNAKKEEYQRLYDEYVAKTSAPGGDFSSDDDGDAGGASTSKGSSTVNGCAKPKDKLWLFLETLTDTAVSFSLHLVAPPGTVLGPVVATTRSLYQKKLYEFLKEGGVEAFVKIAEHIRTDPSSSDDIYSEKNRNDIENFITNGMSNETEAVANGNGTENGYSDSDEDDELVDMETASRASKSSRASSNRRTTPVPSQLPGTPSKSIGVHRAPAATNIKLRHSVKKPLKDARDSEEEEEEGDEQQNYVARPTGTGLPAETLFMSRMASSQKYTAATFSAMKQDYQLGAGTTNNRDGLKTPAAGENVGNRPSLRSIGLRVLLLLTVVAVPVAAYLVLGNKESDAVAPPAEIPDELDAILDGMNGQPGGA